MYLKKRKSLIAWIAAVLTAVFCAAFGVMSAYQPQTAFAEAGTTITGEIWNKANKYFVSENLDRIAELSGYKKSNGKGDMQALLTAVQTNNIVKTSADLGDWSVTLGGMFWNPMYLSKDNNGNAILTLWLAGSTYYSTYSDGTYAENANSTREYNGSNVYANTYDGSYIRNYILGGSTTYTQGYDTLPNGDGTPNSESAKAEDQKTMKIFEPFREMGGIGDYVVIPAEVGWQMEEASWKNDPAWTNTSGTVPSPNYPNAWTKDKLWLPSMCEVYDYDLDSTDMRGKWQTSAKQRSNSSSSTWLRSANRNFYHFSSALNTLNTYDNARLSGRNAVRPALHLNLTEAAKAAVSLIHWGISDDGTLTISMTEANVSGYTNHGSFSADAVFEDKDGARAPWFNKRFTIKKAVIESGVAPISTAFWFYNCSNMTEIDLKGLDTSNVTNMSNMFSSCIRLTTLDVSGFDTTNVTDMSKMFYGVELITTLDLASLNTGNVTNMDSMFAACRGLESLDLTNFDTRNVLDMSSMFSNCNALTSVTVPFDTQKVTSMSYMFSNCYKLKELDLSSFHTGQVTRASFFLSACDALKKIKTPATMGYVALPLPSGCYFWNESEFIDAKTTEAKITNANAGRTLYRHAEAKHTFDKGICAECNYAAQYEVTANGVVSNYETIKKAFTAANAVDSAKIKMYASAEITATLRVEAGKNITLDLNGNRIDYVGNSGDRGSVIHVIGEFILEDNGFGSSHTVQGVTIHGGLIMGGEGYDSRGTKLGGGIMVGGTGIEGAIFHMKGGTIACNTADYGGGVRIDQNATFIMDGGTISYNKAVVDGGGLCVYDAKALTLSSANISNNQSVAGGGIYIQGTGMNESGAIIYNITDSTITDNVVLTYQSDEPKYVYTGQGGGIYIDGSAINVTGGTISGNTASKNGGGIYQGGALHLSGAVKVTNNHKGGAEPIADNLYLPVGQKLNVAGALNAIDNNADIGVTLAEGYQGTFTTGYGTQNSADAKTFFVSDVGLPCVHTIEETGGKEVTFATAHIGGTATCTAKAVCTECGEGYGNFGAHNYGNVTYTWNGNDCTAARTCLRNARHTETETVTATSVTTAPTCTEGGYDTLSAVFTNSAFTTQTKRANEKDALGHNYGSATYTWNGNDCTAALTCLRNATHTETETVTATSVTTAPTCTEGGYDTLTAVFTNSAFTTQTKRVNEENALGHNYGNVTYTWNENDCTAARTCLRDATHTETETVTAASVTTAPTCTAGGYDTLSAVFTNSAFTTQTKRVNEKNALGHNYGSANYTWDGNDCTAARTCLRNATHTETETVTATSVTTAPTCTEGGYDTLTAVFTNSAFTTQTKRVNEENALGHNYGNVTYTWNGNDCTAARTCLRNSAHTETETVTATSVTTAPTCTEGGYDTLSAVFTNSAFTTQTKRVNESEPLGHTEIDLEAVAPTCTEAGLSEGKKCTRCLTVTQEQTTVPASGHSFGNWIPEIAATETVNGTKAHKDCTVCQKHFDENGAEIADLTIPATGVPITEQVTVTVSGGTFAGASGNSVVVNKNGSVTVIAPEIEGKRFAGWSADNGAPSSVQMRAIRSLPPKA